jgi:hypothetical protein
MKFFFHLRQNGQETRDDAGQQFLDSREACSEAIGKMPQLLLSALQSTNTYVTIEVCDQKQILCVVRGTILVEQRRR